MAKYIFTQGQVFVDEDAYSPILKKLEKASKFSVLLIANGNKKAQLTPEDKTNVQTKK